jgi:hypothetical protein
MVPDAPSKSVAVMIPENADDAVKRYLCPRVTLDEIDDGVFIFLEVLGLAFPLRNLDCGDRWVTHYSIVK